MSRRLPVRTLAWRPEQGWRRLCRDIPCSEGTGEALADVWIVAPHRVLFASRSVQPAPFCMKPSDHGPTGEARLTPRAK
ncbi:MULTISPECIES: DUF5999 family protein [unclassified Streptomyces]|uniref:DUF5999 family protein n=1 Tax=unclassified Streptomyces TaxID=2593676 RepID=UPI0022575D5A|nr:MULTISPECIES: DUF5999 family protein [unclassified Streptomyces]MCX5103610.1 DUF5999 family protein [Streptomyces sp. NBC_00439]WSC32185.1 DUF5999 family protein [Streptomyces sp. NBC_01768]WSX06241.1 DUF5999 family protein [Streptomyces sp. NBC_00987]